MDVKVAKPDELIANIAARQHGVVSVWQLRRAGIGRGAIDSRTRLGRLHRVHRGVYAVGHAALRSHGYWMAAVLACGGGPSPSGGAVLDAWGAAVSHRSAAQLWGLLPTGKGAVDVLVRGRAGKKRRHGIRVHRSLTLVPAQVTLRDGIPVTKPARTIADLHRVSTSGSPLISHKELRRAIRQADVLGLPLAEEEDQDRTRGDLERDFLALCRRHRLPAPEVNVRVGPHLVDFLWRDRLVAVETDCYTHHRGRVAFQDDRGRDLDLRARGFDVIRVAEKQVDDEPQRVAEVIGAALRVRADD